MARKSVAEPPDAMKCPVPCSRTKPLTQRQMQRRVEAFYREQAEKRMRPEFDDEDEPEWTPPEVSGEIAEPMGDE